MRAAQFRHAGLIEELEASGHTVTAFSRGEEKRDGCVVSGPVAEIHQNPTLDPAYDTVINYIVLKNATIAQNLEYLQSLLRLCQEKSVSHLIHISSMSVYIDTLSSITEASPVKTDPSLSGAYASLKVAAEVYLLSRLPPGLRLSLVRPAFILGSGLQDAVGSVGQRMANGAILLLGNPAARRPLIVRHMLNKAVARIAAAPPEQSEVILMVDRSSPTNLEYLQACCEILGAGNGAVASRFLWIPNVVKRELKKGFSRKAIPRLLRTVRSKFMRQEFDPTWTENRLGFSLSADWKAELRACASSIEINERVQ